MQEFRLLNYKEAAAIVGRSPDWLRSLIRRGVGPPAKKVSERCVLIRLDEYLKWLDELPEASGPQR